MKPVSVKFKCFGPYMDEQFIDFSELEKNGLFLICGETGAGKTTILDAICYALYCESSGGQRGDIEAMRCKLAEKNDETEVEFVFDSGEQRYKFTRAMKYKTKNLHKYHTCYLWKEGVWEVLDSGMSQVTARAESIVGLSSAQFRQVIILPQGKFEEFLVSDSKKKEEILVTLFDVQQWSRVTDEIGRRVTARANALNQEKMAIDHSLARYGCTTLEALEEKRVSMEQELEELIPQAKNAEKEEGKARESLQTQLQVAAGYEELAGRQRNYDLLAAREGAVRVMEESLALADRAEQIREPFEGYRAARRELERAEDTMKKAGKRCADAQTVFKTAAERLDAHMAREKAMQEKKTNLLRLENARPVYETLNTLRSAADGAHQNFDRCDRAYREKDSALEDRSQELAAAFDARKRARDVYDDAEIQYRLGIGGILAEKLEPGKPCPVCGSTHHPTPAQKGTDHVSEAQLERLSKAMEKADEAVTTAMKARTQAEKERNDANQALSAASQTLAEAQAKCRSAEEQKIPGIETSAALIRTIAALAREVNDWDQAGKGLLDAKTAAQGSLQAAELAMTEANAAAEAARQQYRDKAAVWQSALTEAEFASEQAYLAATLDPREKQRRREQVTAYRGDLKVALSALETQKKALEGKLLQDIPALRQALTQAEKTRKSLNQKQILLDSDLKTLRAEQKNLTARQEKNRDALIRLEADQVFARRLAGSHGVGLQRYVLGVMMNSITAQANRLLENVYGGRYRLYRTDETTGRTLKGGLELEVLDSHNSQRRSVRTLSGGEKFLVALSLAIGLSTVVQAQGDGIRLEAMFIDEGFGSLDKEAIGDALDILQGIRRSAGVVGIISHVDALAEAIPARIEITKGKRGSSAKVMGL